MGMQARFMIRFTIAALAATSLPAIGQAQSPASSAITTEEAAALRAELAALRAHVQALEARLETAASAAASAQATAASAQAAAARPANPDIKVAWKGAPEISAPGGWSFKPRGRVQIDSSHVSAPSAISNASLGHTTELRRAYLGMQGTMPGGFGYRVEADFAPSTIELTDMYLTYDAKLAGGAFNVTVGHQNNFQSLEELTSDLDTSFIERAAFTDAFGFERRVGLSIGYAKGAIAVNAGVFTDNVRDLDNSGNNGIGADGRLVWMPKFGSTQVHLGGSLHWRDRNALSSGTIVYRQRPLTHGSDIYFVRTPGMAAARETGYGLEAAVISGPFHAAGEVFWQKVGLPGAADPRFFGGYAEVGYFLTSGDSRTYKKGVFGAIKPARSLADGGPGAIQIALRYDRLDLNDAGIVGGTQDGYFASLIWTPVEHLRFMLNYGHLKYGNVPLELAVGADRSYGVDTVAARAQIDF